MVVLNDGTKKFHHQTDGRDQQIAGCLKDFRNKPFPVKAKLEYVKNVLTVRIRRKWRQTNFVSLGQLNITVVGEDYRRGLVLFQLSISNGLTKEDNYEICVRAENIFLPQNGFFGMSAATGGLADDHDVLSFLTHSITDPTDRDKLVRTVSARCVWADSIQWYEPNCFGDSLPFAGSGRGTSSLRQRVSRIPRKVGKGEEKIPRGTPRWARGIWRWRPVEMGQYFGFLNENPRLKSDIRGHWFNLLYLFAVRVATGERIASNIWWANRHSTHGPATAQENWRNHRQTGHRRQSGIAICLLILVFFFSD